MRNTSDINFYCRLSKADKKGLAPIEISITINGERKFIATPMKVLPNDFNKKRKPKYIEDYLTSVRTNINTAISSIVGSGMCLTTQSLKDYIKTGGVKSYTVSDLKKDWLDLMKIKVDGGKLTPVSFRRYERICDLLIEKMEGGHKEVTNITPMFIQKLCAEITSNYAPQTSAGMLTRLKSVVTFLMDNGRLQINPFQNIKISKGTPTVEMLSESDFKKILNKHYGIERLEKVREAFVFACGTGMSYCDIISLKPEDIKEEKGHLVVVKKRQKTGVEFCSVVLPFAEKVARKYMNSNALQGVPSNQRCNGYLKEVADTCHIKVNLHFHLGRHYYANHLLNNGVRAEVVSKAVGHANYKTLMKFYAEVSHKTTVEEITKSLQI